MLWRTHFLAGACTYLLVSNNNLDLKMSGLAIGIAGISALTVDIDDPNSKIGRIIPVIPSLLKATIGHRGLVHSFIGSILLSLVIIFILHFKLAYGQIILPVFAGVLSHLVMDGLTSGGIPWFWPWKRHFGLPIVQTGSIGERWIVLPVIFGLFCFLMYPFAVQVFRYIVFSLPVKI